MDQAWTEDVRGHGGRTRLSIDENTPPVVKVLNVKEDEHVATDLSRDGEDELTPVQTTCEHPWKVAGNMPDRLIIRFN